MSDKYIEPNQYFYLSNGTALKNIDELLDALRAMDDDTFSSHVNEHKNDFANWVRDVFKNDKLANRILSMSSRERTIEAIEAIESSILPHISFSGPLLKSFPFIKSSAKEIMKKEEIKKDEPEPAPNQEFSLEKINDILLKEKEISKREEKILEVEEHIERELAELSSKKNQKFFTAEFVQGLLIGLLLALIIGLVYQKFYM